MNDLQELVLTIVSPLVTKPEEIQLDVVDSEDFGRIIGKQGRVAKAIRTIVYGVRTNGPKKVRLNIIDGK